MTIKFTDNAIFMNGEEYSFEDLAGLFNTTESLRKKLIELNTSNEQIMIDLAKAADNDSAKFDTAAGKLAAKLFDGKSGPNKFRSPRSQIKGFLASGIAFGEVFKAKNPAPLFRKNGETKAMEQVGVAEWSLTPETINDAKKIKAVKEERFIPYVTQTKDDGKASYLANRHGCPDSLKESHSLADDTGPATGLVEVQGLPELERMAKQFKEMVEALATMGDKERVAHAERITAYLIKQTKTASEPVAKVA